MEQVASVRQRGALARIGIVALNLIVAGLGLVRLGDWRRGLAWMIVQQNFGLALTALVYYARPPSFGQFVVVGIAVLMIYAAIWIVPMAATWRRSARTALAQPRWSRWYSIIAIILAVWAINFSIPPLSPTYYKTYFLPAEGMLPTLAVNDRIFVDMRGGRQPRRGDVLVIQSFGTDYVKRVAAIAGDRIAMHNGVPVINGVAATQSPDGTIHVDYGTMQVARRMIESLPGENGTHPVLDIGEFAWDETAEYVVPPGHIFVLGDNRDNSFDSRFPHQPDGGMGMVAQADIVGQPLFIYWSRDRSRIGMSLVAR